MSNNIMGDTYDAVTVFLRDGEAAGMKFGRQEGRMYFTEDDKLAEEDTEVVELEEPVTPEEISTWSGTDYPERVQELFDDGDDNE